jgi:hypothetical protein
MGHRFRSSVATLIVAGMALTSLDFGSAQAASKQAQVQAAETLDMSARKRNYGHNRYHRGNDRAAIAAFGMVAGTIAGIAAAQEARRYYRRNYYYDGYYDQPPAHGYRGYYGGYGPGW